MEQLLRDGLASLGLPADGIPALLRYSDLLVEKNKVMNLTAITEPDAVAQLHLLDSAAILQFVGLKGKKVVDVGTGAGFPGMPLRILEDDFDLTLLDLRYAQASAALTNEKKYAAVLCFYGMDTLAAHEILYKLNV